MKTLTLFLVFGIACAALQAQEVEKTIVKDPGEAATTIAFDKLEFDYGSIPYNGNGECVFTFTNIGNVPIILSNVRTSCGCTAPDWSREPIAPGQKGEVKVAYRTTIVGNFNKTVMVYSNAQPSPVILSIKGNVLPNQEANQAGGSSN